MSHPFFRLLFLCGPVEEDERSVLARPGRQGRVVKLEKTTEEFPERNGPRVEIQLYALRVVTQVVICRVGVVSPGIPHSRSDDAFKDPEPGVRAPESA